MNETVIEKLYEFCDSNGIDFDKIDPEVVDSCVHAYLTLELRKVNSIGPVIGVSRSNNDLLFALRYGTHREDKPYFEDILDATMAGIPNDFDITPFSSGLFVEATRRAKCFDILNNGKGITLVITYENAFKN